MHLAKGRKFSERGEKVRFRSQVSNALQVERLGAEIKNLPVRGKL